MEPWFGKEETKAVYDYMKNGGWITEFKQTQKFEELIAKFTGVKHCIVVNNGTISLTLAALACGVKAGDEVIIPNYTMIATPNSVLFFGAKPVFVDVEPSTLCLDIAKVKKAITKKTKAIMLVSANGRYPKSGIDSFVKLCKKHKILLIEDAAQSLGSYYPNGKHIGTIGDVGSLSFSAPKIISTGQGGALFTNNDEIASKIRRLKDFGRARGGIDIHDSIGYNFKFTDLQASVGIAQMEKLLWRIKRKKQIYGLYKKLLGGVKQISFFDQDLKNTTPWFIDIIAQKRDELKEYLAKNNVGTRLMYPPINKQKAYNLPENHKVSNLVGTNGLWLPSSSQLKDSEIKYICNKIIHYYKSLK